MKQQFPGGTIPPYLTLGQVTVEPMSFSRLGDQSLTYRVLLPAHLTTLDFSFYVDLVLVTKGRAEVVMTFRSSSSPFPASQEQQYTSLVVGRLTNS